MYTIWIYTSKFHQTRKIWPPPHRWPTTPPSASTSASPFHQRWEAGMMMQNGNDTIKLFGGTFNGINVADSRLGNSFAHSTICSLHNFRGSLRRRSYCEKIRVGFLKGSEAPHPFGVTPATSGLGPCTSFSSRTQWTHSRTVPRWGKYSIS